MPASSIQCLACSFQAALASLFACPLCGGELKIDHDLSNPALRNAFRSNWNQPGSMFRRFSALLPLRRPESAVSLGEGNTPMVRAGNLATRFGMRELYLKLECCNPTGSFKDRQVAVGLSAAVESGRRRFATVSSGNVGNSMAAYAARSGTEACICVASDTADSKKQQIAVYGARLFEILRTQDESGDNPYEQAFQDLHAFCGRFDLMPMATARVLNPFMVEGAKTIAYELAADLGGAPAAVVAPIGGGGLLGGLDTGFRELRELGLIDALPRLYGGQRAEYFIPLDRMRKDYSRESGGLPLDGRWAATAMDRSGGVNRRVDRVEVFEAQGHLARDEGIFAEPRGAYAIAALKKLVDEEQMELEAETVVIVSGAGLKDMGAAREVISRSGRAMSLRVETIWGLADTLAVPNAAGRELPTANPGV